MKNIPKKICSRILANKREVLLVLGLLAIAGIAHGWNMFHYPYYESDEGTYMAQAWALVHEHRLAYYTYWYDHSPVGWMFLALWLKITGGLFTFGFSVNSGRVLMLFLHILSALFMYLIAKRLTGKKSVGIVAVLFFSLSPLAIYFQRRVLLDNIMVFWTLLSLTVLLYGANKLRYIVLSAITFGVAILSKENAIFFIPVFVYIIYTQSHNKLKKHAVGVWIVITLSIAAIYFIYALLKGEFFPSGSILGGHTPHVSLLGTLKEQLSRSGGGGFKGSLRIWLHDDPTIIFSGAISTLACLAIGIKQYAARVLGLLSLLFWVFLMRGGIVIEFYIIPLIPFIALTNAYTLVWLSAQLKNLRLPKLISYSATALPSLIGVGTLFVMVSYFSSHSRGYSIYTTDQTRGQIEAVDWILKQPNTDQIYSIDDYAYVDLHAKNNDNFKAAEYYWKILADPAIKKNLLKDDWRNIDMLAVTPQFKRDVFVQGTSLALAAYNNSQNIKSFKSNGWGVEISAVKAPHQILASSWNSYKGHFIKNGQVLDLSSGTTTSEGESYALLRAVWSNDKQTFDRVGGWTSKNLQRSDGVYVWKWQPTIKAAERGTSSASDADEDIALAYVFAYNRWNDPAYLKQARKILNGVWANDVALVNDKPYLIAGQWANHEDSLTINPSYLSPAWYKIFAKIDKQHDWNGLVASSYGVLNQCTSSPLDKDAGVLPPEWCALDKTTETAVASTAPQPTDTEYGFNAFRAPFRVSLDYIWNKDARAKQYLSTLSFLDTEWKTNQLLHTTYLHDGTVSQSYESVAPYAGNLGYFMVEDKTAAKQIYETKILNKFYQTDSHAYWEVPDNYYTQNWAWFGTALYTNNLPDLSVKR